jgi:CubicO group peptidase (beta-lactamase class C family)
VVVQRVLVASCTVVLAACTLRAQASHTDPNLDGTVREFMARTHVTGMAVGVIQDGKVVFRTTLGVLDTRTSVPVSSSSMFHLASLGKPFVATSVMQLRERGMLDIDRPVSSYLPYFTLADERSRNITIREVLSHTSGMPDVVDYGWSRPELDDRALERYVRSLSTEHLLQSPNATYAYSNLGYDVLGALVAKVSGTTFESYVAEHVLAPLDMRSTTFLLADVPAAKRAWPHQADSAGRVSRLKVFPYNRAHAPSSTLYSNLDDMLLWLGAQLEPARLERRGVLNSQSSREMTTRTAQFVGDSTSAVQAWSGLGWSMLVIDSVTVVGHGGHDPGFMSVVGFIPSRRCGVVIMTNTDGDHVDVQGLGLTILGQLIGRDWSHVTGG